MDRRAAGDHTARVPAASPDPERMSAPAIAVYAVAAVGGVIGYLPLLTLLLPIKVGALGEAGYDVLAWCGVAGALAAAAANIAFGWAGDRSVARGGGRRGWLVAGAALTTASFAGIAAARDAAGIVAGIVFFQVAVNMLLAQVTALIAEEVPAAQKGTIAALLTLGTPLASVATAVAIAVAAGEGARLAIVAMLMTGCVLPLALAPPRRRVPVAAAPATTEPRSDRRDLAIAGVARLLMQVAISAVGLYLLFYFQGLAGIGDRAPATVAWLLIVASVVPVPAAFLCGRLSDRTGRPTPFVVGSALVAAAGLAGMATASAWTIAAACYVAFATGSTVFLALNIGQAMLLLPDSAWRGRDLGILNLANTLPQIVASPLALWATRAHGLSAMMAIMAVLALAAGALPRWIDRGG